jgi:ferric-dicitrate binding protein FerR (iron transport regulator)
VKDPLVTAGLRALRDEMPSDESCRAVFARLGLAEPAPEPTRARSKAERSALKVEPSAPPLRSPLRWLLLGALLGALALLLQRWFATG